MRSHFRDLVRRLATGVMAATAASSPLIAQVPSSSFRDINRWPMPETVTPEGRAAVAALFGAPAPSSAPSLDAERRSISEMQAALGRKLAERYGVRVESSAIAGVPVRIILPNGVKALGDGPVLLNLHGGGFQVDAGSLSETVPIAALTGMPVVAVLYRLAPEHPYPAAIDDALAVYQALEKQHGAARMAVYGTSAGAALSGQLISRLAALKRPMPAAMGYFSGSADFSTSGDSESWMPLPGGAKTVAQSVAGYIGTTSSSDPVLSPLKGDVSHYPPTLLMTSTRDMLLSPTSVFARKLMEHGVDARLVVFDGLPHAFWGYLSIPETDEANAIMARFFKERLHGVRR